MGAAVSVAGVEHTPAALRAIAAKSGNAAQSRRLLAIALVLEGALRADAARQTGMDRQTLRDWVHRYNALGVDGLISRTARPNAETDPLTDGGTAPAGDQWP